MDLLVRYTQGTTVNMISLPESSKMSGQGTVLCSLVMHTHEVSMNTEHYWKKDDW